MNNLNINFNKYGQPEPIKIYLATPNKKIICELNGICEDTFSITYNLNNACELSFDLDRYIINSDGIKIESNGYELIQKLMRIYVENVGWFICRPPSISNDGIKEIKSVECDSCEMEMLQHDIKNLKINKGTTDSYEMLVDGNVDIIDDVEFAKEQIVFCNKENTDLSFIHIVLKVAGIHGWDVGYIDNVPKEYKYYEDGELKKKLVPLCDEIGSFDIESQDLYSFLTQDAAKFFSCVFLFDIKNMTVNAYRPENLGKNTNINIGFRNLQQSNEITVDDSNIYTRYYVYGNDGLSIEYSNYGEKSIENIEYFLNEKYLSKDVIKKYKLWGNDVESNRSEYIRNTKLYNEQLSVISELRNRVPLDDCSTDWSTFRDEKLLEAQANYQAQKSGYEQFYVDEDGNFDEEALKNSVDANDYYQIIDVILPSIQIEINNRELNTDDDNAEYIDSYKTDWKLYGLDELQVKLDEYQNIITVCKKGKYDTPYEDGNGHTEDYHVEMYEKYLDALNQLDPNYIGGCMEAFNKRQEEINDATDLLNQYNETRKQIAKSVNKETWKYEDYFFTEDDLAELSKLYIDCDYTNENMFLLSSDNSVTAIDEQLKLLDAAQEDLTSASIPQYIYSTNLDNFLALKEYKNYIENLNLGDFIWLGIRDDYVVKLRVISITYNPMKMDNQLDIQFSNMIRSCSSRDDFSYLLETGSNRSKSASTGSVSNYVANEGIGLTSGLIQKLLSANVFKNNINQMIINGMATNGNQIIAGNGSITLDELNAKLIKVTDIEGENAFFEYLQSKLISTDKIIANSGDFKDLNALVASINNLLAGNVSAELGHVIEMTAENVHIDEAVIRDLIAAEITVSMLQAGTISADKFHVKSDDGGMSIIGNTMQFRDSNGNLRIQIGRDANNNFTFVLYDETGTGVLMDASGIKPSAIGDGVIHNNMLAGGITEDKLGFKVVKTDENGKICITEILDENGQLLGVTYKEIQKTVQDLGEKITDVIPYNIFIENEYQNVPCIDGISKDNILIEIPFVAYKGTEQVSATVTTSVLPTGVTVGSNTPSTETSKGMLILNVANGATFGNKNTITGYINLTFTIESKIFSKRFTWSKTNDGDSSGASIFVLESSNDIIKRETITNETTNTTSTTLSPSSVTFSAYIKTLDTRSLYSGRFIIEISKDGVTYNNSYVSSTDESTISFTPDNETSNIKCTLYQSGGTQNIIDRKTIVILDDISNVQSEFTKIKNSFVTLSDTVDKNTKSISEKVSQTDIDTSINNYDNTTVKTIKDTLSEHTTSIGSITDKVSSVETTLETKADGSTVEILDEKVSAVEQNINGFRQTVENNYLSKNNIHLSSRNLLRNSKTMIFDSYILESYGEILYISDEYENILTDELGNSLIISKE